MGTPQNTAAIYVRRSAVDSANTEADAFSRSLAAQERECLVWAERQGLTVTEVYRDKTGTSASHLKTNRRHSVGGAVPQKACTQVAKGLFAAGRAGNDSMLRLGTVMFVPSSRRGRTTRQGAQKQRSLRWLSFSSSPNGRGGCG